MKRTIYFQDRCSVNSNDVGLTDTFDYLLGLAVCDPDASIEVFGVTYKDFLRNKKIFSDKKSNFSLVHYNSRETLYAQQDGEIYELPDEIRKYEEEFCEC